MFYNPSYIPPSPTSPSSPITPLDAYVMADLIQGTITEADPAIVVEIAEHIVLHNISGEDFLDLSETYLRRLSKDDDQVFKVLKELQNARISPDVILSSLTLSLSSLFAEPHNFRLSRILEGLSGGVNNMGNEAVIQHDTYDSGDLTDGVWDFSDEDDHQTPDPQATVVEAAAPRDDINLLNRSLHPVAVNPALENGPSLASSLKQAISITHTHAATTSTSDGATHLHSSEEARNPELQPISSEPINSDASQPAGRLDGENSHLQNDSVLTSPFFSMPSTRSSSPLSYLSYVDSDDEDPDAATQHTQIHLDNNAPIPHTTRDPSILIEHNTSPIISRSSGSTPEPLTQIFLDVTPLDSLLSRPLVHPQTTPTTLDPDILIELDSPPIISVPSTLQVADNWQITENDEVLEPPCLPASEPAGQTMVDGWKILEEIEEALEPPRLPASEPTGDTHFDVNGAANGGTYEAPRSSDEPDDAIHEDDSSIFSNTGSMDCRDSFASIEIHESIESYQSTSQSSSSSTLPLALLSSHDIDDSNKLNVDTAMFTLPDDIIPVTPLNSPVFEGLSQYMILGAVLEVNEDNVSTPVQRADIPTGERTLRPSSEALPFGLSSSSTENEQSLRGAQQATNPPESPGPNVDVAVQPASDPPYLHITHVQARDQHFGRSTSPLEYMQSEIWRLLPTFFALRRETMDHPT